MNVDENNLVGLKTKDHYSFIIIYCFKKYEFDEGYMFDYFPVLIDGFIVKESHNISVLLMQVCPICSVKVARDMLSHITLQHGHLFKISFTMEASMNLCFF